MEHPTEQNKYHASIHFFCDPTSEEELTDLINSALSSYGLIADHVHIEEVKNI